MAGFLTLLSRAVKSHDQLAYHGRPGPVPAGRIEVMLSFSR